MMNPILKTVAIILLMCCCSCEAFNVKRTAGHFVTSTSHPATAMPSSPLSFGRSMSRLYNAENDETPPVSESKSASSLEEKMKNWEPTEEERKAATLGGVIPGRTDAFDVGLWIAFPIMVATGLLFAFFPLIMGNLDVSSVGPPPTI